MIFEHFEEGVLTFLGRSADGVEDAEAFVGEFGAVSIDDGLLDAPLQLFRFALHHGGLVGDTDVSEVEVGVETFGVCAFEFFKEGCFVAAVADVLAEIVGVCESEDDEEMALFVRAEGAGGGGLCFFVFGFSVDDGGAAFFGVVADAFPDAHDVATGGVDDDAAFFLELVHGVDGRSEGWDDDDVAFDEFVEALFFFWAGHGDDAHFFELTIDLWVVDDFAEEVERFVIEDFARGVGEVDGAFDAVAETELACEADGGVADGEDATVFAEFFDERAAVVFLDDSLDFFHDVWTPDIHTFWWNGPSVLRGCSFHGKSVTRRDPI